MIISSFNHVVGWLLLWWFCSGRMTVLKRRYLESFRSHDVSVNFL
jgi:hypothetical protein